MKRLSSLSLVFLAASLAACASESKPALSYIDVAAAPPAATVQADAVETEPGRILEAKAQAQSVDYVVQRLRDDTLIKVSQPDAKPLPTGLKVGIRYGSPVRIEAAPTTPDIGAQAPPLG